MAVFKCKMCGGDLAISEGSTVATCQYCGTQQTVPGADNEKKISLFSRANRLRMNCEFDKAFGIYESIVVDFPEEAEAYWGLVLCKYGIEYVDDPTSGKKIPTCHRSSFNSVMKDADYEQTLENADSVARKVYREEAKTIEEIRKGIVAVSSNEEPYDIFICYKETDEKGERTLDSVLAQNMYNLLVEKGYRVFFSRITLEDKLGQEYEPYIFAALTSARVMLAFGTDYEYYNTVWVKNEWSRFLKLMEEDHSKHLIPCYKGIDAYDLPKEFAKLQAQDLGKVGATQDLLRGVEKIIPKETVGIQQTANNTSVEPLLERLFMFIADSRWNDADEYCEKVFDIDPKCAKAHLGKLMVQFKVQHQEKLAQQTKSFMQNIYYQKAVQFGDEKLQNELKEYAKIVSKNAERAERKAKRVRTIAFITTPIVCVVIAFCIVLTTVIIPNTNYNNAVSLMEQGKYGEALSIFESLGDFEDSADRLIKCRYHYAIDLMDVGKYGEALSIFEALGGYEDSADRLIESKYNYAIALIDQKKYEESYNLFYDIAGYKDSNKYRSKFSLVHDKVICKNSEGDTLVSEYTYDSKGNLIKEEFADFDVNIHIYEYTYDVKGNLIKEEYGSSSGFNSSTTTYTYDSKDCLFEKVYESNYSGNIFTDKYTYDSKGNLIKEEYEDSYGVTSTTYTYDSKDNLVKKVYESDYEGYIETYKCTYDSKGNLIKQVCEDSNGDIEITTYTYDDKGNLIKEEYEGPYDVTSITYTYDSKDSLVEETVYNYDYVYDSSQTYNYTYDSKGNLIKEEIKYSTGYHQIYEYNYEGPRVTYNPSVTPVFSSSAFSQGL